MAAESLDAIQGMTTLKAFNAHERKLAQFRAQWQDNGRAAVRLVATAGWYEALVGVAITVGRRSACRRARCCQPSSRAGS